MTLGYAASTTVPAVLAMQALDQHYYHEHKASIRIRPPAAATLQSSFPRLRAAVAGRQEATNDKCLRSMRQLACRLVPLMTQLTSLELTGLEVALTEGDLRHFTVRTCSEWHPQQPPACQQQDMQDMSMAGTQQLRFLSPLRASPRMLQSRFVQPSSTSLHGFAQ